MTIRDRLLSLHPHEDQSWPKSLWRASGLGYCMRQQLMAATGMAYPIDTSLARKFAIRTGAHEVVQSWMVKEFGDVMLEHYIEDKDRHVGGHSDAILVSADPKVLVEIKTAQQFYFKNLKSGKSKPYWGAQIDFYGKTAAAEFGEEIDVITLLIEAASGEPAIIDTEPVPYEPIADMLNVCWETRMLPPVDEATCRDCNYTHICNEPLHTIDDLRAAIIKDYGTPIEREDTATDE